MNSLTALQSRAVASWQRVRVTAVTDSDTEECFPDGFGTSWDVNFHRMSSEIVYFRSPLEKQLAIN